MRASFMAITMTARSYLADADSILGSSWARFSDIARHVGDGGTPFPDALPAASACDFDHIKGLVCKYRAGNLRSVDAVLPGNDGYIYFIEFKDVSANPIADLKKKAFDSLPIFWLSLGRKMSMREICARAIFVYVKPNSESKLPVSDLIAESLFFVQDVTSLKPPKSSRGDSTLNLQLNELRMDCLYHDVIIETAQEFCEKYDDRFGRCDKSDFIQRLPLGISSVGWDAHENDGATDSTMSLNRILIDSRTKQGGVSREDFCSDDLEACDFGKKADGLLRKREYDHENAAAQGRGTYYCADAFRQENETVYAYHSWSVSYPIATAVNRVFDSFLLWAWIYHEGDAFETVEQRLGFVMISDGVCPEFKRHPTQKWLQQFYDSYEPWFNGSRVDKRNSPLKFGLACYRDALKFYGDVVTPTVEDFANVL